MKISEEVIQLRDSSLKKLGLQEGTDAWKFASVMCDGIWAEGYMSGMKTTIELMRDSMKLAPPEVREVLTLALKMIEDNEKERNQAAVEVVTKDKLKN